MTDINNLNTKESDANNSFLDEFDVKTPDQMRKEIEDKMEFISESVTKDIESVNADDTVSVNDFDVLHSAVDSLDLTSRDKESLFMELLPLTQLPEDSSYIGHEEGFVKIWNANADKKQDLYSRMIAKNKGKPEYVFMDGPPFVSGNLHPGHVAVGSAKSAIHIYKIMKGMLCVVKLGYDCHGLPAVNKAAAENNLDTLEKIKAVGLAHFNEMCERMILKYSKSWTPLIQRLGRFADFDDVYMTRDLPFMETCIWIFKQLWEKGLVYKGNKVMAYSYGNQTPLSNFEASQNYQEKESKSIYVRFEIEQKQTTTATDAKEYLVAWTTTPWTLPLNLALCVNADLDYVRVKVDDDKNTYILGSKCLYNLYSKKQKITILETFKGSTLVGTLYKPMFPFTQTIDAMSDVKREYTVLADNYVSEGDIGSAIVHLAPAFGDDDFRVCAGNGLIDNLTVSNYCPLDDAGKYTDVIEPYKGRLVFECEDDIRSQLKKSGDLLKIQLYKHNYPFCWRTETPLIYRTTPSYYIRVTALKDRLIELNKMVRWHPKEVGENRFHQWLCGIKDWAVSRSTSYATPIMLWSSEDGSDTLCVGSISELESMTGQKVTNLHPEFVNDLVIEKEGKIYKRIPDTFDCWFESGAVPMGQLHYPFDSESKVLESREFLSDFICEGMDQTRGWFYTLMVLSGAIFNKPPYRDVMCTGMILDKDGRKFSKKLGNFVDPQVSINEFGSDVIRTYFINSPVLSADCLKFNEEFIGKLKKRFTPYINGVKFWIEHTLNFVKQKSIQNFKVEEIKKSDNYSEFPNLFDKWILLKTNVLVRTVTERMESFQLSSAVDCLLDFIEQLTNWYIKFNRDRLKGLDTEKDWTDSIRVLYNVLMTYCRLWAPFTPFLSEHIYQHLRCCSDKFSAIESVMLTDYPEISELTDADDHHTLDMFGDIQRICCMVRAMRDTTRNHSKMVVPLKSCTLYHDDEKYLTLLKTNLDLVQSELNCNQFIFERLHENVSVKVEPDRKAIGSFFRKEAQSVIKLIETQTEEFMCKVYDGTDTFTYKSDQYDEVMDHRFYKLIRTPKTTIERDNFLCRIDKDLMVGIDQTYDSQIHNAYQMKRLHSAIQNARKVMGLRPWNTITVILDLEYATDSIKNDLYDSLTNADVVLADFSDDQTYGVLSGLQESEVHLIHGEEFCWESFDTESADNVTKSLKGRIIVHYCKASK